MGALRPELVFPFCVVVYQNETAAIAVIELLALSLRIACGLELGDGFLP